MKKILLFICTVLMFSVIVPTNALNVQSDTITVKLPIIQNVTDGVGDNADKVIISYTLSAENPNTPMPDDADNEKYSFSVVGKRQSIALPIVFSEEGIYHYTLTANSVNTVVKPVVMNITVYIFNIDGILTPYLVSSLSDGKKTDGIYFTAGYIGDTISTEPVTEQQSEISTEFSAEKLIVPSATVIPTDDAKDNSNGIISDLKSVFLTGEGNQITVLLCILAVAFLLIVITAKKKSMRNS